DLVRIDLQASRDFLKLAPVTFSTDGRYLAFCLGKYAQLLCSVWDLDRKKPLIEFAIPALDITFVALSPDVKQIATWGVKNNANGNPPKIDSPVAPEDPSAPVCIWNVHDGKLVRRLAVAGSPRGRRAGFSPDGKSLIVIGHSIESWD